MRVRPSCGDKLATPASVQRTFSEGRLRKDKRQGWNEAQRRGRILFHECLGYGQRRCICILTGMSDKAYGGSYTKRIPVLSLDVLGPEDSWNHLGGLFGADSKGLAIAEKWVSQNHGI